MKWSEDKIISELKEMCKKGTFPSKNYLRNIGRTDLLCAMSDRKGFLYYRSVLGFNLSRRPSGYWKKNHVFHVDDIVKSLGRFPTNKELIEIDSGLFMFLKSKKLLPFFRAKYGYVSNIMPNGYWDDFNNIKKCILKDFSEIIEQGMFPTRSMVNSGTYGFALSNGIAKNGGFIVVAEKMGCRPIDVFKAPDGHYLDSTYELFLDWYLCDRGISHKVHGKICKDYRYEFDFKVGNFYIEIWGFNKHNYNARRAKKEELYKKLGLNLISVEAEVFARPYFKIEDYFDKLFSLLGFDISKKTGKSIEDAVRGFNYWSFENTLIELRKLVKEFGGFPTVSQLRAIGKSQVLSAVQKHGGQDIFREKFGLPKLKSVKQFSLDGNLICEHKSITDAAKKIDCNNKDNIAINISRLVRGKLKKKSLFGYKWSH